MSTCSICLRETTPYRDRTGTLCDRSAPDGDPIQCVSVGQRAWQARAEELERELAAVKLDVHTIKTAMDTVADLASRLESALARAERAEAELARLKAEHGQPRWYAVTHVGFQHCPTEAAARERAEWSIGTYRDLCDPEWDLEVEAVEYGRVIPVGVARVVSRTCAHDEGDDAETVNYALVSPATYTEPPFEDCGECEDYEVTP